MTPPGARRGFVLILVLALCLAILGLVLSFNERARQALRIGQVQWRQRQAWACAHSGVEMARQAIAEADDPQGRERLRELLQAPHAVTLATGLCRLTVADEGGKLDLQGLRRPDGSLDRARVDRLLRLLDVLNRQDPQAPALRYGLVPALIDWTDPDDEVTVLPFVARDNRGAERRAYADPCACPNRPLRDLAELAAIRGFDPNVVARLRPFVTLYGQKRVNLRSASPTVILALSEHLDPPVVRLLVERRRRVPLASPADLQRLPGMTERILQDLRAATTLGRCGPVFLIEATGEVGSSHQSVRALVRQNRGGQMADIVRYEQDRTTARGEAPPS